MRSGRQIVVCSQPADDGQQLAAGSEQPLDHLPGDLCHRCADHNDVALDRAEHVAGLAAAGRRHRRALRDGDRAVPGMAGGAAHRDHHRVEVGRRLMHGHGGQTLDLGNGRDDADPAAVPAQLSRDLLGVFQVPAVVGQHHQIAVGAFGGRLQLVDSDTALCGEHRDATERSDSLGQPGTGDHGQDTALSDGPTRRQRGDPELAQLPEPSAASTAAPASPRWTCTCATARSPTMTTLWPSSDSSSRSASRSDGERRGAYTSPRTRPTPRPLLLPCRRARRDGCQRLGGRSAEHFDQHVDQQDVRLAAGIDDSGRGQHLELLRRTSQGCVGAALGRPDDGQGVSGMAAAASSAALAAASATVRMVPATGRATARRAATATVRSKRRDQVPAGMACNAGKSCSSARQTLVNISATIAPELPCADRIAAWTMASRLACSTSGTA